MRFQIVCGEQKIGHQILFLCSIIFLRVRELRFFVDNVSQIYIFLTETIVRLEDVAHVFTKLIRQVPYVMERGNPTGKSYRWYGRMSTLMYDIVRKLNKLYELTLGGSLGNKELIMDKNGWGKWRNGFGIL